MLRKATDEQLISEYKKLGNIWKVAKVFDMCGQSVHERLQKLNFPMKNKKISEDEINEIRKFYLSRSKNDPISLKELSNKIHRTPWIICKKAGEMKLTNPKRKSFEEDCKNISIRTKKYLKKNGHPRGMLGKHHSPEHHARLSAAAKKYFQEASQEEKRARVTKILQTKLKRYGSILVNSTSTKRSWKQGWRTIAGKRNYYRSRWEANFARYLQKLKEENQIYDWEHEPHTFWFKNIKRGSLTYIPDFKVWKDTNKWYYVEVKGWWDQRSKTKVKRFKKYFPEETLIIVDAKWFKENSRNMQLIIKEWEVND